MSVRRLNADRLPETHNLEIQRFKLAAHSLDLPALDFFLRGDLKLKVYINKPPTLQHLKQNIRDELAALPHEVLDNIMEHPV